MYCVQCIYLIVLVDDRSQYDLLPEPADEGTVDGVEDIRVEQGVKGGVDREEDYSCVRVHGGRV